MHTLRRQGYIWVTLAIAAVTLSGHFVAASFAFVQEQAAHAQPFSWGEFLIQWARDVLENIQSEAFQLVWQVWGLSFLMAYGSPQSKEGSERVEAKLDAILWRMADGPEVIGRINKRFENGE